MNTARRNFNAAMYKNNVSSIIYFIMKKIFFNAKFCFLLITCLCFSNCEKSNNQINITLSNKSLSVIQSYIQGEWKLEYETGGFCACSSQSKDSFFLYATLSPTRIILKNAVAITTDTTINWKYVNFFGDSTYVMNFFSPSGVPFNFAAKGIFNDTLVLYQPGPDGTSFYYTKLN